MQTPSRIESSYAIYREFKPEASGPTDQQEDVTPASSSSEMRHFMRLFLAVQAEMNQAMTTLSIDALEAKIQELMTAAERIQDDGEKAAAAQRSTAIAGLVAGSVQVYGGARSIRAGESVRIAAVDSKVATARAAADPADGGFLNYARRQAQTLAQAEKETEYSKMLSGSSGQLGNSIGQVDSAEKNEEASARRREQKIAEAASARAEALQSGASQSIQGNKQAAIALLQAYQQLLQEKNQMEKVAQQHVV